MSVASIITNLIVMKKTHLYSFLFFASVAYLAHAKKPHIIFIVADDLGWNDVGFHNPQMITPNIDKLAGEGLILNQSYVQPVCTPSRNSFLSGVYPFKSGLQHGAMLPRQPMCAPLNQTYLPQKLKELGYATHAIGKWHLGFCKWECTPTYRGFDTFYGFYNGQEDYYSHTIMSGEDFRDNKATVKADGEYSAHLYARRASQIIKDHNVAEPMFIYLPFQSVHSPIQVPKEYEDMYPNIQNSGRRQYCGMVTAMDEAIGNITTALKEKGIYDDTLIIFTADNGGWPQLYGNNYPLRGAKVTVFEGGTRASAFVHGFGLQQKGIVYDGMIHAVDWMPTILGAAGGLADSGIDGVDQWESITTAGASKRTEFIYNLDDRFPPLNGHAAIRSEDYKLIDGFPGPYPGWYKPQSLENEEEIKEVPYDGKFPFKTMLFNLKDDPEERNDLSRKFPEIVEKLKNKMKEYKKEMVPAIYPGPDPGSSPKKYGGFWTPGWC